MLIRQKSPKSLGIIRKDFEKTLSAANETLFIFSIIFCVPFMILLGSSSLCVFFFMERMFASGNEKTTSFQCNIWVVFSRYVVIWKVIHLTVEMKEFFLYKPNCSCFYLYFNFTSYDLWKKKFLSQKKTLSHLLFNQRKTHIDIPKTSFQIFPLNQN